MWEKCAELDKKLAHFHELSGRVMDRPVLDGIHGLIAKYEADKKALHPEGPAT